MYFVWNVFSYWGRITFSVVLFIWILISLSLLPFPQYLCVYSFFAFTSSVNEVILLTCGTAVCSAMVKVSRWILVWDHNFRKKLLRIQFLAFWPQDKHSPRQKVSSQWSLWHLGICLMVSVDFCLVSSILCCKTGCYSHSIFHYGSSPWEYKDGAPTISFLLLSVIFYWVSEETQYKQTTALTTISFLFWPLNLSFLNFTL